MLFNTTYVKPYYKYKLTYNILLTKTTAVQNEDALSYHRVRGLYFQAVVIVATIVQFDLL